MSDARDFFVNGSRGWEEWFQQAGTIDSELVRQAVQHLKSEFSAYGESIKLPADSTITRVVVAIIRAAQSVDQGES